MTRTKLFIFATCFGLSSIFYLLNDGFLSGMVTGGACALIGVFGEHFFGDSENENQ